jgi:hypothetical protein
VSGVVLLRMNESMLTSCEYGPPPQMRRVFAGGGSSCGITCFHHVDSHTWSFVNYFQSRALLVIVVFGLLQKKLSDLLSLELFLFIFFARFYYLILLNCSLDKKFSGAVWKGVSFYV